MTSPMHSPPVAYPARYSDARGHEATTITNDGTTLQMSVRGVTWHGPDFDLLEPAAGTAPELLAQFSLHHDCLVRCEITCEIPVRVRAATEELPATLSVELLLGAPTARGNLDEERLRLTLRWDGGAIAGNGTSGHFEDELLEIQRQLPPGVYIRTCINCAYSDYSPGGGGLFGWMSCFRNVKAEYLQVRSKADYWPVLERAERSVQETYHCDEFERRRPGTGYRG